MGITKLSEIAKKYDLDVKKLEKSALKHNMNLSDGKDSIIKKGDELRLLKDAGITLKSETHSEAVKKTEKTVSAPLLFLEDIKSETSPVYRTDLSHELFLHNDVLDNLTSVNNITELVKKRFNLVLRQISSLRILMILKTVKILRICFMWVCPGLR